MIAVSVAMATFNGAAFIQEQLNSIARQTIPPKELVVADDGSTDETLTLVENFARTAPFPVHVIRNPSRLGYRANFMQLFEKCASEAIAACDQDDIWDPRKLEIASAALEDPQVLMFCHDAWLVGATGARLAEANVIKLPPSNPPLSFHPFINPLGFAIVFRRNLLQLSDRWQSSMDTWEPQNRMAHDQWLTFLASVYGTTVFSDEKLTNYRQHSSNAYGWKPQTLWNKLRFKFSNPAQMLLSYSRAAASRADILERHRDDISELWRERAKLGAEVYRRFSNQHAHRAQIYLNLPVRGRIKLIRSLIREGSYSGETVWDLNREALAKDVILGLVLRRVLVEPSTAAAYSPLHADPQPGR